jgi:TetR/AcrR family transcriptional regulator, transcriptional repressor for nem operon
MGRLRQETKTGMARPREFDIDEALDAAMGAFWGRGYEGTSLADLMHAMGVQKGSIYKAFGDKHALFLCALQRYLDKMYEAQRDTLAGARSPRAALRAWLDRLIEAAPAEGGSCRGCLAVNTLVELGPHDEQARAILEAHFERMRALLMEQIRRGQEAGEFRRDVDAGECARFLMTMVAGLLGSLKGATSKPDARRLAQTTLQLLT